MAKTLSINGTLREGLLKEWDEKNILGLHLMEKKQIFLLAVALGIDSPKELSAKKEAYVRIEYLDTYDKSILASILLGKPENKDNIDKYANEEESYKEAEKCAESGFYIMEEFIKSANDDMELLEKRAFAKLNLLYQKNVASNL